MSLTRQKERIMWPFLAIGGIAFLGAAGVLIHTIIYGISGLFPISYNESLFGVTCLLLGFVSVIVILAIIGATYEKRRNYVVSAIVLLLLFIGFELFATFYPGFAYLGGLWGNIAILAVYGFLRGFTLRRTNESLKSPIQGYGSIGFGIYGWSFVTTTILSFIFVLIGTRTLNITMINIGFWILFAQFFIDVICFLAIGIKFIQSAFVYPSITGVARKPTPTITTTTVTPTPEEMPVHTESQDIYQQEIKTDDPMESISDESVIAEDYCANCGSIIDENTEICESCGEARL